MQIREARTDDLPELAALLGARADQGRTDPDTRPALLDLDPARVRAWVTVDDGRIVAIACAELRRLQIGARTIDAGYWTTLHASDDYRDQLPHLARSMLDALAKIGVEQIYRVSRLDSAQARPYGELREITRYTMRLKPLRPLSLIARRLGWPSWVLRATEAVDRIASLPAQATGWRPPRLPPATSIVRLSLPEDGEGIAELLTRAREGLITRSWSVEDLCARYGATTDGGPYTLLGLCRAGAIIGVAVYRVITGETGARLGVILELAARDDDPDVLEPLLRALERQLQHLQAEGVLLLDALGPTLSRLARQAGYLDSDERYVLTASGDALGDVDAWRFPLGDHDGS